MSDLIVLKTKDGHLCLKEISDEFLRRGWIDYISHKLLDTMLPYEGRGPEDTGCISRRYRISQNVIRIFEEV